MNMMISYQELVRTFPSTQQTMQSLQTEEPLKALIPLDHQVTEPAMLKARWPRLHCMLPTPIIK